MKDFTMKISSGSERDKIRATKKQNKWANPFYKFAREKHIEIIKSHKRDSIRESLAGIENKPGFLKGIIDGFKSVVSRLFRRKVIA